jgi:hypothetical protein
MDLWKALKMLKAFIRFWGSATAPEIQRGCWRRHSSGGGLSGGLMRARNKVLNKLIGVSRGRGRGTHGFMEGAQDAQGVHPFVDEWQPRGRFRGAIGDDLQAAAVCQAV